MMRARCSSVLTALLALAVAAPARAWPGRALVQAVDSVGMTVSDMDRSVRFFTDALGFEPVSDVEVTGEHYEHLQGVFGLRMRVVRLLNTVFGARLRITALRAQSGPGIELLEYLAPRDGRPMPSDERANDVAHWQTRVVSRDGDAAGTLGKARAPLVSPGAVALPGRELGFTKGFLVRDPDGHVLEIVEAR